MRQLIITSLGCLLVLISSAQTQFIVKGKIEYERKINVHKQLDNDSWGDMMKKSIPQFKIDYFDLYFDNNRTLYKPGKEVAGVKVPDWASGPAFDNVVFTDLENKKFTSQKSVFESSFLIQDSLRKVNWKISADTRTIAGFECRKATTIIMDSIYVIAFFTDQIIPHAGPESFTGLPGMILGLAVPRLNTTWFATKLELVEVKETDLTAPKKGKKTTMADLDNQLKTLTKDWGESSHRYLWKIMI